MNKSRILVIIAVILLLTTAFTLVYLRDSTPTELKMTLLSERVQEVEHGETAEYEINVLNIGEESKIFHISLTDVPEHWHASLDKEDLVLAGDSQETITLTVTAPPEELARTRGLVRVAEIGVRGGNVTIGTITILHGTATVFRDGSSSPLSDGDNITSGDNVTTVGSSRIDLDFSKLVNDSEMYEGTISLLLDNAKVNFQAEDDTVYMSVKSGDVTILVEGEEAGSRAPSPPPRVNLSEAALMDLGLPEDEYAVVLEFDPFVGRSFFHLNVTSENTSVEVYDGAVVVENEVDNRTIEKYEQTTAVRTAGVPEPEPVERTIITLDTGGSVEGSVESQGSNILDLHDVHYFPTEKVEFYIAPLLPEVLVDITGQNEGEYEIDFAQITNNTIKSFSLNSTVTTETKDGFSYSGDSLKVEKMEEEKTYNLTIEYEDTRTDEKAEFEVIEIRSSDEDQEIAVDDWEQLDEAEEEPVTFREGDKEVKPKDGSSGEDIEDLLTEDKDDEKFPWLWVGFALMVMIGAAAYTDAGRFRLFLSISALVTRVSEEDIETDIREQNIRGMIYQHIEENPGTRYTAIQKAVKASNGTVCYHLDVLGKRDYIRSKTVVGKKYYWVSDLVFPDKKRYPKYKYPPLDEDQQEIVTALQSTPSSSAKELSLLTAIPGTTLYRKLQKMTIFGMVNKEWGLPSRYSLNKEYEEHFVEYETKIKEG